MKNIISLLLFFTSIGCFSQRLSFDDPDLTFSFKKPKRWEVFDDGYLVKISPSTLDSADTFFSFTYFEDAKPFDGMGSALGSTNDLKKHSIKIDKVQASYTISQNAKKEIREYQFYKKGQRFVVKTGKIMENKSTSRSLEKLVKSIRITDN